MSAGIPCMRKRMKGTEKEKEREISIPSEGTSEEVAITDVGVSGRGL